LTHNEKRDTRPVLAKENLKEGLQKLGLRAGMNLMVHS